MMLNRPFFSFDLSIDNGLIGVSSSFYDKKDFKKFISIFVGNVPQSRLWLS